MRVPLFLIPKAYAKKKLEPMLSDNWLKPLSEPLHFLLTKQLTSEELQRVNQVERLRSQLLVDSQKVVGIHHSSSDLAPVAEFNIRQITDRYEVMNTSFDTALDLIFSTLQSGLDLVYLDGQHEKDATLHYFERVIPYLNQRAVVLFDDIYWSKGMTEAWDVVRRWKGCARAVDLGRLGLCVWGGLAPQPKNYSLRAFTDHWRKGHAH